MHGRTYSWLACVLATTVVLGACQTAWCQGVVTPEPASAALTGGVVSSVSATTTFGDLEARIVSLESALADNGETPVEAPRGIDVSGQKWKTKWGGRIMGDLILFNQNPASQVTFGNLDNYFEFRRIRIFAEGEAYGIYDFKLQVDFEPEVGTVADPAVAIKDMYIGVHDIPLVGYLRLGHYKVPFSIEELTSANYITFMERALPVLAFHPEREVGVCAYNHTPGEMFTWAFGAFLDDVPEVTKERVSDAQGIHVVGRVAGSPYYAADGRGVLHFGAAAMYTDDRDNSVRFRVRPEVHEEARLIDTGTMAIDDLWRFQSEAALVWGPFSVQGEAFYVHCNAPAGSLDQDFYGAYAYASFFLTGECRNYKRTAGAFSRVKPFTNFFLVRTPGGIGYGWGALELAGRWSYVDLWGNNLPGTAEGTLHDVTLGLNWHWNPHMRMMFEWVHAMPNRQDNAITDVDVIGTRWQVDF